LPNGYGFTSYLADRVTQRRDLSSFGNSTKPLAFSDRDGNGDRADFFGYYDCRKKSGPTDKRDTGIVCRATLQPRNAILFEAQETLGP
jgi:hypothetical protein